MGDQTEALERQGQSTADTPRTSELTPRQVHFLTRICELTLANIAKKEVLRQIASGVCEYCAGIRGAAIFLKEGEQLRCEASAGPSTPYPPGAILPAGEGLAGEAILARRPLASLGEGGRLLFAPVQGEGTTLGMIVLAADQHEAFAEERLGMIALVASETAVAMQTADQRQEMQRRLVEHLTLRKIHSTLGETLDLDATLQLIATAAIEILPRANGSVIHLLDVKNDVLKPVAVAGKVGPRPSGITLRPGVGLAGRVMATNAVINVGDVLTDPATRVSHMTTEMRSLMVAPVYNTRNSLGTISVQSSQTDAFSADDERLLYTLGIEAAVAIHNARLYQAERRQRQMAEALVEAAFSFNRSLEIDKVLDRILEQIVRVVPCKTVSIVLIEGEVARIVRQRANPSDEAGLAYPPAVELPLTLHTLHEMIRTGQPILVSDTTQHPQWRPTPGTEWIRSFAGTPLIAGQKTLGFLTVDSQVPDFFSEDTTHALQAFAAHAAIALQNAQLYRNLETVLKEEKIIRAQLLQADKLAAMGRITSSIAHEVNNPMQAIQGCLERAQAYVNDPEKQRHYLHLASEELNRLTGILGRVLDFQRPADGEQVLVDARELLEDILALVEKRLQLARVRVELDEDPRACRVRVVSGQIKQVFLNLILNAVEAMPDGGTLSVGVHTANKAGRWVQITFADTGSGIEAEHLGRLFEPFFTTKADGNGLGLWISNIIITSHNGRLTAESPSERGSIFTVWLPRATGRGSGRSQ